VLHDKLIEPGGRTNERDVIPPQRQRRDSRHRQLEEQARPLDRVGSGSTAMRPINTSGNFRPANSNPVRRRWAGAQRETG